MYQYPYGNAQQLNLDWILGKIQELEAGTSEVNIEEVANALVSASFDAGVSYRRYDYCFYNGKLYRALNDNSGAFNPSDWLEVVIGDDIPVLTRLLNTVDASLTTLQGQVADLDSDDVDNASNVVSGATVTNAIDNLNSAINVVQGEITAYVETGSTASRAYGIGNYFVLGGNLAVAILPISQGETFTQDTNFRYTTVGNEFNKLVLIEKTLSFIGGSSFIYDGHIKSNSKLMAGISYLTPGQQTGSPRLYFVTVQPNIDGRAVVYIRNADGSTPADIDLTVYLIVSNQEMS